MADFIVAGILFLMISVATIYIIKAKKSGAKCIGCPSAGYCSGKKGGHSECKCGCHSDTN